MPSILYEIYSINYWYNGSSVQSGYSYGENFALTLLINPAVYLAEFVALVMTGESIWDNSFDMTTVGGPIRFLADGNHWIIASTVLFLAVSFLFLWLAARRIDPARKHRKGR